MTLIMEVRPSLSKERLSSNGFTNVNVGRAEIEAVIEILIGLLDQIDGDENLEPYLADTDPSMADREFDSGAEFDMPGTIPGGIGA